MAKLDWSKAKKFTPDPARFQGPEDPSPEEWAQMLEGKKQEKNRRAAKALRTREANRKAEVKRQAGPRKRQEAADRAHARKQAALEKERADILRINEEGKLPRAARPGNDRVEVKKAEQSKQKAKRNRKQAQRKADDTA